MKRIFTFLVVIFATQNFYTQTDYSNVVNLLIENKRVEARKLFDKQFGKTKNTNIDLLFLDAMIDEQSGRINYDETLLKAIENLPNSQHYIAPFINESYVMHDIKEGNFSDLTYQKIDFLASSPKFKSLPIVQYRKGVFDAKRYRNEAALQAYNSLNVIKKWQFCGVFENLNSSGLEIEYEPEKYPKSDKLFNANSNGILGWYTPKKEQDDPYYFFGNEAEYGSGVIYAQTFVKSNETKEYLLSFGANKGVKIFLNDKEIYFNTDIKQTNLDAYSITLPLSKGFNRLLFKIEIGSVNDYFSAQIKNKDFSLATNLSYEATYQPYEVNKNEAIEVKVVSLEYEKYFEDLVKNNPNNILYKIFLFQVYQSNNKKIQALKAIEDLDKKYPKSSLINSVFIRYYDIVGDENQKILEIAKNIEANDPEFCLNFVLKMVDKEWLTSCNIQELEKYKNRAAKLYDPFYSKMFDFMITSRKGDIDGMISQIEVLYNESNHNEKMNLLLAGFYHKLKNDKAKTIKMLEEMYAKIDSYEAYSSLIEYYNDLNQKEKLNTLISNYSAKYYFMNDFRNTHINFLIKENNYAKALELIDENLAYFPYSFTNMEKKASVYALQKNEKEAEKYIRKALVHNSGNEDIRKQLYDITKTPDEIEEVITKNIYDVIKKRRNSKLKSDYGVVTLLDEFVVNVLPEGGRKSKVTFLYEITSENGIEDFKEYSVNSSATILKSEIVKKDGSLVPAEDGGGTLVFSDLKVGDVIHICYTTFENASGRFYKDFNVSCYFNSSYPSVETIFTLLTPENVDYKSDFSNGIVPSTTTKINGKKCVTWKRSNVDGIPTQESYSPIFSDITNTITVGTIKEWKEISNWYADLVKKQLKQDNIIKQTFNEIFPNGFQNLTEEERAKKIYSYIESNIKYSSLDFRQSGYVPQKPSKTITTKLGDCKDVSTLFVVLSELAGLKSNLVLVLTNDNGLNTMKLPTSDFNHCIVRTILDKKEVFLELTDKYLPFRALPSSLYKANALVISFDKVENETAKLINIPFDNALKNITKTHTVLNIDDKLKTFVNKHVIQGAHKSYYNELFSDATTDDLRKKDTEESFNSKLKKTILLESIKVVNNETFDKDIVFESKFTVSESLQKVGSLKITEVPFIDNIYTRDIISTEKRNFPINYHNYEAMNEYETEVIMNIPQDKSFSEVPVNKELKFKNHNYAIAYELVNSKTLKITRKVDIPWEDIATIDYPEYKKFVESVIEAEEQIVGFK